MALPTAGQIAISNFRSEFILSSEVKTRPAAAQITINAGVYLFCSTNVNDVFSEGKV